MKHDRAQKTGGRQGNAQHQAGKVVLVETKVLHTRSVKPGINRLAASSN